MFNVNDIVVCGEEASLFYGITNSDAILMVTKVPDENDENYHTKCIRHKTNSDFIGSDHQFEKEVFETDFQAVDDEVSNEIRDEAFIHTDWILHSDTNHNDVMRGSTEELFRNFINNISESMDKFFPHNNIITYTFSRVLYNNIHADNFETLYNSGAARISVYDTCRDNIESLLNDTFDYLREGNFTEVFIKTNTSVLSEFEDVMEEQLGERFLISSVPYVCDCFTNPHRIIALEDKANGVMYYVTNYATADVFLYTAVWYMETHNIFISEDMKNALLNSDKLAFLNATNTVLETYERCLNKIKRKKMIREFSDSYSSVMTAPIEKNATEIADNIKIAEENIARLYAQKRDYDMKLFYYKNKGSDEFIEFISGCSNVISATADNRRSMLIFDVLTYMTYWDDDDYKTIRESDRRFNNDLYNYQKQLLDDIFMNRSIRLRIEQKFAFSLDECRVFYNDSVKFRRENGEGFSGMRNPHITRYSCFGTHESVICKLISQANIIQAYNQAVAACSGLTWTDGTVVGEFFEYLNRYDNVKCLEYPDGTVISIADYRRKYEEEGRTYNQ